MENIRHRYVMQDFYLNEADPINVKAELNFTLGERLLFRL